MDIRFVSRNVFKNAEATQLLHGTGINIIFYQETINELQTENVEELVYDKALKAFKLIGKPLIVEHTSLCIDALNDLPGGLTQIFWDRLKADKFCALFGHSKATIKTIIAYCDGMTIQYFDGSIEGSIAGAPRGSRDFNWDCIFIPAGTQETFAEMKDKKNEISMRKNAFEKLIQHLVP